MKSPCSSCAKSNSCSCPAVSALPVTVVDTVGIDLGESGILAWTAHVGDTGLMPLLKSLTYPSLLTGEFCTPGRTYSSSSLCNRQFVDVGGVNEVGGGRTVGDSCGGYCCWFASYVKLESASPDRTFYRKESDGVKLHTKQTSFAHSSYLAAVEKLVKERVVTRL